MIKHITKFILLRLWNQYRRDERVLHARYPIGTALFSADGFILWLLFDVTERKTKALASIQKE